MKMKMKMKKLLWLCGGKEDNGYGYVGVYVGRHIMEMCKLEMEANFLNHPLLEDLLRMSEEEFGYSYDGALRIPCDLDLFQHLLHLLRTGNPSAHYLQLPHLISNFNSITTTRHASNVVT